MAFVESANPPVNWKGRCGGVSDLGILSNTGKSCSAEMVWLLDPTGQLHSAFSRSRASWGVSFQVHQMLCVQHEQQGLKGPTSE